MGTIQITKERKEQVLVFSIKGRLDAASSPIVEESLMDWIEKGENRIVGNLSELEYISSSGIRILLQAAKHLQKTQGKMALCGVRGHVKELLQLVELPRVIPAAETEEEGVILVMVRGPREHP
ncbi:MAG: STAS domain-containing protein [bacterium]|jgi:anti-anti-sigma factor|nr:STAS domain-containing protein [bacterium]